MGPCSSKNLQHKPLHSKSASLATTNETSHKQTTFVENQDHALFMGTEITGMYTKVGNRQLVQDGIGIKNEWQHLIIGVPRAVLEIRKSDPKAQSYLGMLLEANIIHNNVVQTHEYYSSLNAYFIVQDLCSGITLGRFIQKPGKLMSEDQVAYLFVQVVHAVQALHDKKLIHGRISTDSFCFEDESENLHLKLCDYANMCFKNPYNQKQIRYASPNLCSAGTPQKSDDVWSCGMILYELLDGQLPFNATASIHQVQQQVKRGCLNTETISLDHRSKESRTLLLRLLDNKPEARISLKEVLLDKWIKKQLGLEKTLISKALARLKASKKVNKLKQALFVQMIKTFSHHQYRQIYQLFHQFDENQDGLLSKEELIQAFKIIYPENKQIHETVNNVFEKLDQDRNDTLDFEEFAMAIIDKMSLFKKQNVVSLFNLIIDKDTSQKLEAKTLAEYLKMSEQEVLLDMELFYKGKNKTLVKQTFLTLEDFRELIYEIL